MHEHFVKTGLIDTDKATFLSHLKQKREQEDYGEDSLLHPHEVSELIETATAYVAYIETLIPKGE